MKWGFVLIDFSKYKENLSIDAFVSIVSKDFIKELDDATKNKFKNGISFIEMHFSYSLHIRNKYIYPYLVNHKFSGKKSVHPDDISMMIICNIIKKVGGKITDII